jgi:hypothetical protein
MLLHYGLWLYLTQQCAALNEVTRSTGFMSIVSHFIQPRRHSNYMAAKFALFWVSSQKSHAG